MTKTLLFDSIYIIESLEPEDKKTGTVIYNDIVRRWCEKLGHTNAHLENIKSDVDFSNLLSSINEKALYPYIHFEMHGCKQGLVLNNGELIEWIRLSELLRQMNISCRNNLFVSFASCYSAYFIKAIASELNKPSPVLGLVAVTDLAGELDLEISFLSFFHTLLVTNDFTAAIDVLNDSEEGKNLFSYMTSDALFEHLLKLHRNPRVQRKMEKDIFEILKSKNTQLPSNKLKKEIKRWLLTMQEQEIDKLRKVFLHK